jgi:hypothetical protein
MNKIVYILWLQGFENAPFPVKHCLQSWIDYNPTWNIVQLDENCLSKYINLDEVIPRLLQNPNVLKCHIADIVRLLLLEKYGGVWVDATTFCNRSLDEWLPEYVKTGFFAFDKPRFPVITKKLFLSNWFLYSEKRNHIITQWSKKMVELFQNHELVNHSEEYFIFHRIFEDLYYEDIVFQKTWDNTPKYNANGFGPHYLDEKGPFSEPCPRMKYDIDRKIIPLFKCTYKWDFTQYTPTCVLRYLLDKPRISSCAPFEHSSSTVNNNPCKNERTFICTI